jgi:hypothetical protein
MVERCESHWWSFVKKLLVSRGKKLRKIKTTKSPGPDMFPNKILKTFAFELAPVISDIFNSSMTQATFPKALKRSILVPVPKVLPPKVLI